MKREQRGLFKLAFAIILTIMVIGVSACSSSAPGTTAPASSTATAATSTAVADTATPLAGGTLTVGVPGDALTLDPMMTVEDYSAPIESLIYNSLVKTAPDLSIQPDLASSWEVTSNGLTYTFTLRQNVQYHDGSTMKADDVVYSFNRIMSKPLASPWASFFENVQSVKTVDQDTVEVKLKKPYAAFLAVVASYLPIMNQSFVDKHDLKREENGTGPYILQKWTPNESITLLRNPKYFDANNTYLDKIVFQIIPQDTSRIAALQSGQVQFAKFKDPSQYAQLEALGKSKVLHIEKYLDGQYHVLGINTTRAPFDNPKVRLALSYAINRQALLDGPGFGQGKITGILSPSMGSWAIPTSGYPSYTQNIANAKELLKEAGYPDGFSFKMMTPSTFPLNVASAVMMQSQLKEIGVTAEVIPTEWGTYVDNWVKRNFDSFAGENPNYTDPDMAAYAALHTAGSTNVFGFSDPAVDKLLDQGRESVSLEERHKIYAELQPLLVEQSPMIYTFSSYALYAMSPKLQGYVNIPSYITDYRTLGNASLQK